MAVAIPYKDIYGSWDNFYEALYDTYVRKDCLHYFYEIYRVLPDDRKQEFMKRYKSWIGYILTQDGFMGESIIDNNAHKKFDLIGMYKDAKNALVKLTDGKLGFDTLNI